MHRLARNLEREPNEFSKINKLHMALEGNSGTGKATIARIIGELLKKFGVLKPNFTFHDIRAETVAERTLKEVKKASRGILYIDEAHVLAKLDNGASVISKLIGIMNSKDNDVIIMFTGNPHDMHQLYAFNEGLKSLLTYEFKFDDYSPDQLVQLFITEVEDNGYLLSDELADGSYILDIMKAVPAKTVKKNNVALAIALSDLVISILRDRDYILQSDSLNKKNGKLPHYFGSKVNLFMFQWIGTENSRVITKSDLKTAKPQFYKQFNVFMLDLHECPLNEDIVNKKLDARLHDMSGLSFLRHTMVDIAKKTYLDQVRYQLMEGNITLPSRYIPQFVITGNPGTGKTTSARLIMNMLTDLCVIPKGVTFTELSRDNMVGSHEGETEAKMQEIFNENIGGVIFVDEAYRLTDGGDSEFGKVAFESIMQQMTLKDNDIVFMFAGKLILHVIKISF